MDFGIGFRHGPAKGERYLSMLIIKDRVRVAVRKFAINLRLDAGTSRAVEVPVNQHA